MSQSIGSTRDGKPIGAWLFKANPEVWDVHTEFDESGEIPSWSVRPSYRTEILRPGQRCFLWVGEDKDRKLSRGIYGVGEVVGVAEPGVADESDLWRDEDRRRAMEAFVPVLIRRLKEPILAEELRSDPRFAEAEVFRSPQMSNPVVLRPKEVSVLDEQNLSTLPQTEEQPRKMENDGVGWDPACALVVEDGGYSAYDDSEDDPSLPYVTFREWDDDSREREQVGRHATLTDVVRSLAPIASQAGRTGPIFGADDVDAGAERAAFFRTTTGVVSIARTGDRQFYAIIRDDDEDANDAGEDNKGDDDSVLGPWFESRLGDRRSGDVA